MKTRNILIVLASILISLNNVFATKIIKHRDHWGILGGYNRVAEVTDETSEGPVIELWCTGWGDMKCKSDIAGRVIIHENGRELTTVEYDLIESLHQIADYNGSNGNNNGSTSETITIGYPDGTTITYTYFLIWYINANGEYVSEVTFN